MSSIHLEVLDEDRQSVFRQLSAMKKESVLGGGTALSLQIGHRYSFDFDLFFRRPITQSDLLRLKEIVSIREVTVDTGGDQLSVVTTSSVKMTLLSFPFADLFSPRQTGFVSIKAVRDIALDKAYAIGRRAVWRDYVDLYFILKEQMTIRVIAGLATTKFEAAFNPKLFVEQALLF